MRQNTADLIAYNAETDRLAELVRNSLPVSLRRDGSKPSETLHTQYVYVNYIHGSRDKAYPWQVNAVK